MSPTVYLDTSVICYLADPPSANSITRACQQLTRLWWMTRRVPALTYSSNTVKDQVVNDGTLLAAARLNIIEPLTLLDDVPRIHQIAELLALSGGLTRKIDAMHVAQAAYYSVEVVLTWDCAGIAKASKLPLIRLVLNEERLLAPEIVTVFEMMENSHEKV